MEASDVYAWLMQGGGSASCSGFEAHVLASVLAVVAIEANGEGHALVRGTGLEPQALLALVRERFPHAAPLFERAVPLDAPLELEDDERCLRELLARSTSEGNAFEQALSFLVARRCQRPNHLWQDLGLRNRRELSWLMERHFPALAQRNQKDMKWKKFLYRVICRDEGFSICTAPTCTECSDFDNCYGEEDGESLLARNRRAAERAAAQPEVGPA
jgi:nitrogen fixation protein NifQ